MSVVRCPECSSLFRVDSDVIDVDICVDCLESVGQGDPHSPGCSEYDGGTTPQPRLIETVELP